MVPGIPQPPVKGTEQPISGRTSLDAPRLLSSAAVPLILPGDTEGCAVGQARRWSVARGGREGRCSAGGTKTGIVLKLRYDITITTAKRF